MVGVAVGAEVAVLVGARVDVAALVAVAAGAKEPVEVSAGAEVWVGVVVGARLGMTGKAARLGALDAVAPPHAMSSVSANKMMKIQRLANLFLRGGDCIFSVIAFIRKHLFFLRSTAKLIERGYAGSETWVVFQASAQISSGTGRVSKRMIG